MLRIRGARRREEGRPREHSDGQQGRRPASVAARWLGGGALFDTLAASSASARSATGEPSAPIVGAGLECPVGGFEPVSTATGLGSAVSRHDRRSRRSRCRPAGRLAPGSRAAQSTGSGAAVPVRASHPGRRRARMSNPHAGSRADAPRGPGARGRLRRVARSGCHPPPVVRAASRQPWSPEGRERPGSQAQAGQDNSARRVGPPRAGRSCGAGDGTRTRDSLLGKQVLYQLSYPRLRCPRILHPPVPACPTQPRAVRRGARSRRRSRRRAAPRRRARPGCA